MNRIGDILVGAKAIPPSVRDRALAHRGKSRIRFGTALLEIGGISEALLLRALSVQRQAPPASGQDLAEIRPDILRLVPGKLASRLFVVPFRRVGRVVSLAMRDPSDLPAVDEVSFLTGLQIQPHIALDARINFALARHYGIDVDQRYLDLARRLDQPKPATSPAPPPPTSAGRPAFSPGPPPQSAVGQAAAVPTSPPPPPGFDRRGSRAPGPTGIERRAGGASAAAFMEGLEDPWASGPDTGEPSLTMEAPIFTEVFREARPVEPALEIPGPAAQAPAPDTAPISLPSTAAGAPVEVSETRAEVEPAAPPVLEIKVLEEIGEEELRRLRGVPEEETAETTPTVSALTAEEPAEEEHVEEPPEALDLVARLSRAESRDDIAEAILEAAAEHVKRAALFIVQADRVIGWSARPQPPDGFRSFAVKFSEPSLFATLRNTDGFYAGPLPDLPGNHKILAAIGSSGGVGTPVAVVPVTLRAKSVLFLLGEGEPGSPPPAAPPLRRLASMTAVSLEIVLLKNRLRQM